MDDVICDFSLQHRRQRKQKPENAFPQGVPGFFLSLQPIEGAIDGVNRLRQEFDTFILTAPSTRNPHCYSEKRIWIEEHFDYELVKRLIISPDKGLLKGDYLIDDQPTGKGQDRFEGTLLQFGSSKFPNWEVVLGVFCRAFVVGTRVRSPAHRERPA